MPNIEYLKQLRRVVEAVPEDRLHMRTFSEKSSCGTARCAAGWFAVDPWARENTGIGKIFEVDTGLFSRKKRVKPRFFDAAMTNHDLSRLFGITSNDSLRLFGFNPPSDLTPHAVSKAEVLANIDRLINGEPAEVYEAYRRNGE